MVLSRPLSAVLLILAVCLIGLGCEEPSSPVDGYTLAADTYRRHFNGGHHGELLGSVVIIRGDAYLITLQDGPETPYVVPRPRRFERRTLQERVSHAEFPRDVLVTDSVVLRTLSHVVASFEETGVWRVVSHRRDGGASIYVTPQDVLDYAGPERDTRVMSHRPELQPIAPAWSYYRLSAPADAW